MPGVRHNHQMRWEAILYAAFARDFEGLSDQVQDELLANVSLLQTFGPALGRPTVDTLKGSRHANMKELRFNADGGVWRVAFAFDPQRRAVLLVAANKSGISERLFYRRLISQADDRYDAHLRQLREERSAE